MIEYNKLFILLNERGLKKTDLLNVISAGTLAKLSKNGIIQTDTIDKICLYLGVQPSDIMEVFEKKMIDGKLTKVMSKDPDTIDNFYSRGNFGTAITISELEYLVNENGVIDRKKLNELLEKSEKV